MTHLRPILFSLLSCIGVISTTLYTSCQPDKCNVVCHNGGTCNNNACICPPTARGTHCEISTYTGNWEGRDTLLSGSGSYAQTLAIVPSTLYTGEMHLYLSNGHASGDTLIGTLENSGLITYSKQAIHTTTTHDTVSGQITLWGDSSIMNVYIVTHSDTSYQVRGVYMRQ